MPFKCQGGAKLLSFNSCLSHLIIQREENLIYDTVELNFYMLMEDYGPFLSQYSPISTFIFILQNQ